MSYIEWLRRRIGPQKTILIYSTVVVRDAAGAVLLQRRSDFDWWGLPGGILEYGEDISQCARREVREETGLEVSDLRLVGLYTHPRYDVVYPNGDAIQQFTVCFSAQAPDSPLRPDGVETLELAFFGPESMATLDVPPWYRAMIAATQRGGPPVFEWEPPAHSGAPAAADSADAVWREPDGIMPAAVAVVRRGDGCVYQPADATGQRRFPWRPMALGETAAATAVRAADGVAIAPPDRLLGIVSRPGSLGPTTGYTAHVVAGVFMLRAAPDAPPGSDDDWVRLAEPAEVEGCRINRLVAQALAGRTMVDEHEEAVDV
jgi:8-oxo-dGTP pyrophosphatase MutT (NUDIX family)